MKVLLINKYLYPRAGAETALLHTRELLRARGHTVIDFAMRHPDNLPSPQEEYFPRERRYEDGGANRGAARRVGDAVATIYSVPARRALARLLDAERPDIAHLHNIYHQLTFSIVDELYVRRIPMVQTLHDWKIACPSYNLFTEGAPCHRCAHGTVLSAVKHRCIKGSASASVIAATEAALAHRRGSYLKIGRYIAPSAFAKSVAVEAGMPAERVSVLPYLMPQDEIGETPSAQPREATFFHGGRLDETKGVRQLLAAFGRVKVPARLVVAGWGELEGAVQAAVQRDDRIQFLGRVSRAEVLELLSATRALLLPSTWEDNCPLVMLEAQARGTPVIASNRGGPPEFVIDGEHGFIVDPDDTSGFAGRITCLAEDPQLAAAMGARARRRLVAQHNVDSHYEGLLHIYRQASEG